MKAFTPVKTELQTGGWLWTSKIDHLIDQVIYRAVFWQVRTSWRGIYRGVTMR